MSRYKLTKPAGTDLDEIWLALAGAESEEFATREVERIAHVFPMLGDMPETGRLRPEIESGLRSFPIGDYMIYYHKANRGGVQIRRVIHAKRDQLKALRGSKPRLLR